MMIDYASLIGLGIQFLESFLGATKTKVPAEIAEATEELIAALRAHRDDVITKANLEAQRG